MLHSNGVRLLVDVRTLPKSRTNPQFNREALQEALPQQYGMQYMWMGKDLGGLRKRNKQSELNAGWDNASFRGYADHMQSEAFARGLRQLMQAASGPQGPAAVMCAEVEHFRCHRSLISDALTARGWRVSHIPAPGKAPSPHKLTSFAVVDTAAALGSNGGCSIIYPAYEHTPKAKASGRKCGSGNEGGSSEEQGSGSSSSSSDGSGAGSRAQSSRRSSNNVARARKAAESADS